MAGLLPLGLGQFDWAAVSTKAVKGLLYIVVVLVVARVSYALLLYILRKILVQRPGKFKLDERKAQTLFSLLRSVIFYLLSFTVLIQVLKDVFGLETGTLLASAGVLGVALGFGSQSLVKDIIGGFFVIFEDQYAVGEYIRAAGFEGTVEEIGLRATRLRDWGGELHIIPNGSITAVTNFNRGKMRALVDMQISYDEDVDKAMSVMHTVCDDVAKDYEDKIVEPPTVQGIIQFGERYAVLRVVAYTKPNEQWGLERELRRRIHRAFLQEGIQISQPQKLVVADKRPFSESDKE